VTHVAAGYAHTIALTREGRVYTWGCGLFGQLGTGNTTKHVRPTRVKLPGRVVSVTAGYFHNIVMLETGELMTWGANPQILRLEAQQRKKEKLMLKQMEEKRRQEMEAAELEAEQERTMESLHPQDSTTTTSDLHLNPSYVDTSNIEDRVAQICAGSQHSALLTSTGQLFTWGRNLEGQLGLGNRQSVKVPSQVTALDQDVVTMISAGADFTCAVSDLGTVYAWGSNASGQLGRIPVEDPASGGQGDNSRVLVMKTTKRIIRLQHGLQNSCDVPRPVQLHSSINGAGIYPETAEAEFCSKASSNQYTVYKQFPSVEPIFSSKMLLQYLHLTIEKFQTWLDSDNILRLCLMMDNPLAAAKISLINRKYLQAFDLSLQAIMKHRRNLDEHLLATFEYYNTQPNVTKEDKCSMFERLVGCWQEQKLNFHKLESYLLDSEDKNILNVVILTLFCPNNELKITNGVDGPSKRSLTDVQLVDLFSPEFNLKIGDLFTKQATEHTPSLNSVVTLSDGDRDANEKQLRCIATEAMDRNSMK